MNNLKFEILHSGYLIKNYINGFGEYSYEDYMVEFINKSAYFLELAGGNEYTRPKSESHGECDCISSNYEIDLKLFGSSHLYEAKSTLYSQLSVPTSGVKITHPPKIINGSKKVEYLNVLARLTSYQDTNRILKTEKKVELNREEIVLKHFLDILMINKNLLFFIPYRFFYDADVTFEFGCNDIISAINNDLKECLKIRYENKKNYDTFFSFVFYEKIIFCKYENGNLLYVDDVNTIESKLFSEISQYC